MSRSAKEKEGGKAWQRTYSDMVLGLERTVFDWLDVSIIERLKRFNMFDCSCSCANALRLWLHCGTVEL